jgi:predicted TIM-barrel fold metal-dependent hydrolase
MSKIDFHVHITPPEISADWRKYAEKEPYFSMLSHGPRNKFASAPDIIAALDTAGFDKAVVFGFAFNDAGLCRYVNDYVIDSVTRYPDRLIGFMVVPPGGVELEDEIQRCHTAGLRGVGELFPEGQGFDIADTRQTAALATACTHFNIPLLIHANEPLGHHYPGKTKTSLRSLEQFIENNPGLEIVLAHWGGGLLFYETMPEMREKCRNVYYDTAAAPLLYDPSVYRAASAIGLSEKILFGSDFPLLPHSRYIDALATSGISLSEQERILGGNAIKLLNGR